MGFQDVSLKVDGARQLRKTLREASEGAADLKPVHKAVGDIVTTRGSGIAPRGDTGNLANSVRTGATKTATVVRAGNNRKTASGVPYAAPIHWGWPERNIQAQPFLAEAAKDTENQWVKLYMQKVEELLDQIKGV